MDTFCMSVHFVKPVQSFHEGFHVRQRDANVLERQGDAYPKDLIATEPAHRASPLGLHARLNHSRFADVNDSMGWPVEQLGHFLHRLELVRHDGMILSFSAGPSRARIRTSGRLMSKARNDEPSQDSEESDLSF